jgi:hypothetical protein
LGKSSSRPWSSLPSNKSQSIQKPEGIKFGQFILILQEITQSVPFVHWNLLPLQFWFKIYGPVALSSHNFSVHFSPLCLCLLPFGAVISPVLGFSNDVDCGRWSPHECSIPNLVIQNMWNIGHYFYYFRYQTRSNKIYVFATLAIASVYPFSIAGSIISDVANWPMKYNEL